MTSRFNDPTRDNDDILIEARENLTNAWGLLLLATRPKQVGGLEKPAREKGRGAIESVREALAQVDATRMLAVDAIAPETRKTYKGSDSA